MVPAAGGADAWAAALAALAGDRAERDRLGAAARERAGARFNIEQMLAGVAAAYDAVFRD